MILDFSAATELVKIKYKQKKIAAFLKFSTLQNLSLTNMICFTHNTPFSSIISTILAALLYPICSFLCKKLVEAFPSDLTMLTASL